MRDVRWLPPREDTQTVVAALIKQAKKLPPELYKSLTWDWRKDFRIIVALRRRPKSTYIFAIRKARGSAGRTRTLLAAETVLSEGHRLVGALASRSEQSGSSAQRTTT
jgi:hypothetical protein